MKRNNLLSLLKEEMWPAVQKILPGFSAHLRSQAILSLAFFILLAVIGTIIFPKFYILLIGYLKTTFGFVFTGNSERKFMVIVTDTKTGLSFAALLVSLLVVGCTYMKYVTEWRIFMANNHWTYLASLPPAIILFSFIAYTILAINSIYFYVVGVIFAIMYVCWDIILCFSFLTKRRELENFIEDSRIVQNVCPIIEKKIALIDSYFVRGIQTSICFDAVVAIALVIFAIISFLSKDSIDHEDAFAVVSVVVIYLQSIAYTLFFPEVIVFWRSHPAVETAKFC